MVIEVTSDDDECVIVRLGGEGGEGRHEIFFCLFGPPL